MAEAKETTALLKDPVPWEFDSSSRSGNSQLPSDVHFLRPTVDENNIISSSFQREDTMVHPVGGLVSSDDDNSIDLYGSGSNSKIQRSLEKNLMSSDRSMMLATTSNLQTLMHLIKGNLGTGVLALPLAFKHAGLWTGFCGILILGMIATHCMHILADCSHNLCRRTNNIALDYPDVMELSLKTGPERLRRFARPGRIFVNALLIFTQFGFCSVYIVFVATNIDQVISHFHTDGLDMRLYELIIMAFLIPYIFVRRLDHLAPFSAFANLLSVVSLIIIIQYIVQGLPDVSSRPAFSSIETLPLFFGTAIFAVEGISLILPLENKMRNPQDFGGSFGVLNLAMVIVVCFYAAVAFYGYLKFGDDIEASITLNMPKDNWLYLSVKMMFAVAIFISYGIQFYVPIKIIWPMIKRKVINRTGRTYGEYVIRMLFLLMTFGFAVAVPHLDLLISLIGAFASSSLALILPSIIELVTYSAEGEQLRWWSWAKNIIIFTIGIIGFLTGTYTAMKNIVQDF